MKVQQDTGGVKVVKRKVAKARGKSRRNRRPAASYASRKPPRKKSIVWHFFKPLATMKGEYKATCQLCNFVSNNPTGTTSAMRGHLARYHSGMFEKALEESRLNESYNGGSTGTTEPTVGTAAGTSYRIKRGSVRSVTLPPPPLSNESESDDDDVGGGEIDEEDGNDNIDDMKLLEIDGDESDQEIDDIGEYQMIPAPPLQVYSYAEVDTILKSIIDHLVANMKPLRTVEDATFINLLYSLNKARVNDLFEKQDWSILKAVTHHLEQAYEEMKESVRQEVSGKSLSLSIDFWVKSKSEVFVMVTANYISDCWTLSTKLLGMRQLPKVFTGPTGRPDKILEQEFTLTLTELLDEYQIKSDSITIVVVNASPFDIDFNIMARTTWHCVNETFRNCCLKLNHDFKNLTDEDILSSCLRLSIEAIPDYEDIRHHPGRLLAAVKEFISTSMEEEDTHKLLLEHIDTYNLIQEPLSNIIDGLLEASTVPASLLLPLIVGLLTRYESLPEVKNPKLNKVDNVALIETVTESIQKAYQVDFTLTDLGDITIALCTFLDPRYKAPLYFPEELRQQVYDTTMELLIELKEKQEKDKSALQKPHSGNQINGESDPLATVASPSPHAQSQNPVPSNTSKLNLFINETIGTGRGDVSAPSSEIQEELNKYMAESKACMSENPLEWWRHNCGRFPNLSELAKRYKCIQGSTSPAQRTFTPDGKMFFKDLALIEPEYLEKIMCLRSNSVTSVTTFFGYMETQILQNIPVSVMVKTEDVDIDDDD